MNTLRKNIITVLNTICLNRKIRDKTGSFTIEGVLSLWVYLMCLVFMLLMLFYTLVQMNLLRSMDNVEQEFSLLMALYQGYHQQTLEISKREVDFSKMKSDSFRNILKESRLNLEDLIQDLSWTYGSYFLGAPSRFLYWYREPIKKYPVLNRIKNFKYFIEHEVQDQVLEVNIDYSMDFLFFKNQESLKFLIPTWTGVGQDKMKFVYPKTQAEKSIWKSHNFKRGRFFSKKEQANLPFNFPVIQKFENGKATMIKSIDLNKKTYKDKEKFLETLKFWKMKLEDFEGGRLGEVHISKDQMKHKELVIYIPEDAPEELRSLLVRWMSENQSENLTFVLKTYEKSN